jgi:hypothetical protein
MTVQEFVNIEKDLQTVQDISDVNIIILIYHFPCPPCWYVGNSSYEHQFNTSAHAIQPYEYKTLEYIHKNDETLMRTLKS